MAKTKKLFKENLITDFLKGIIVAMLLSLALVVVFALCIKWFVLDESWIVPITLLIKGVSVLIGALVAVCGDSRGLLKGASFGAIYIIFAFFVFSILAGTFEMGISLLLDIAFASLLGAIVGIFKVNKK